MTQGSIVLMFVFVDNIFVIIIRIVQLGSIPQYRGSISLLLFHCSSKERGDRWTYEIFPRQKEKEKPCIPKENFLHDNH